MIEDKVPPAEINPVAQISAQPSKQNNLLKIILFVFLGLIIMAGAVYAGMQMGKRQLTGVTTPTSIPTQTEAIPTQDPTANWKTYKNSDYSFKYPEDWQFDSSGTQIISVTPKISLWLAASGEPMMNECMSLDETKIVNNLKIKKYSRVSTGERCSTTDSTPREIWITKGEGDGFAPGIQYLYKFTQAVEAEKIFDQILSTFKFLD